MSKPPSILSNLEALDVIADLGAAASRKGEKRAPNVASIAPATGQRAAPQASPANDLVYTLLLELKRDIDVLKQEQHAQQMPPMPAGEAQLYGLLSDLKHDIELLRHEQASHHLPPGEATLRGVLAELKRDIVQLRNEQAREHLPTGEAQLYDVLAELRRDIVHLRQEQSQQSLPSGERQLYAMLAEIKREIHDLQHAADEATASAPPVVLRQPHFEAAAKPRMRLPGSAWSWREGATFLPLVIVALLAGYTFLRSGARPATPPAPAAVSAPQRLPSAAAPAGYSTASAAALGDVLATPQMSPRGQSVQGVDAAQALAKAGGLMSETGPGRDTEEAGFWLRRYLATAHVGDRRLTRALTQLGSLYAEPTTARGPDFTSARMLWEVAASLGDPVGMCFLGRLYEHGLGVPVDRLSAAQWLERARAAGGCAAR